MKPTKFQGALHAPVNKYFSFLRQMFTFNQSQLFRGVRFEDGRTQITRLRNQTIEMKLQCCDILGKKLQCKPFEHYYGKLRYDTKKLAHKIFTKLVLIYSLNDQNICLRYGVTRFFEEGKIPFCHIFSVATVIHKSLPFPTRSKFKQMPTHI